MNKAILSAGLLASASFGTAASAASFLTAQPAQLKGGPKTAVQAIYTIGDTLSNGYRAVGILDGIGAYKLDDRTVRLLVNSEVGPAAGYAYSLASGATLTGARVSFFDVNIATRAITNGGIAYTAAFDRTGALVTSAAQLGAAGFNRFCSSAAFEANTYGTGRGLADRIYFTGEETSGGTMYALDTASNQLHAVPQFGRFAFENATQLDTGTNNKVAFVISDDSSGASSGPDQGTPMYLYVGTKGAKGDGSFLDRNGLASGQMYVWKSTDGKTNPTDFSGKGSTSGGEWVEISNFDPAKAGQPGYDAQGYATTQGLREQATAAGAFRFSRPEDVATNPADATLIALASTGSDRFGGADRHGAIYTIDTDFDASGNPTGATTRIVYDGNQDGTRALRNPDNLDWASADRLVIQEDRAGSAAQFGEVNKAEAGILEVTLDGVVKTFARIDRSAIPAGQTDINPGDFGNWESSGILDVSELFGLTKGTLFVADTQAHSIRFTDPTLNAALVEGGQLLFLQAVPEPTSWAMMISGFATAGVTLRRRRKVAIRFA